MRLTERNSAGMGIHLGNMRQQYWEVHIIGLMKINNYVTVLTMDTPTYTTLIIGLMKINNYVTVLTMDTPTYTSILL